MGDHELTTDPPEPDTDPGDRPEPVMDQAHATAVIVGVIVAAGGVTTALGYTTSGQVQEITRAAGLIVEGVAVLAAIVVPLWRGRKARALVTPLAAPRSVDGEPLMAVTTAAALATARDYAEPLPTGEPAATDWSQDSTLRSATDTTPSATLRPRRLGGTS